MLSKPTEPSRMRTPAGMNPLSFVLPRVMHQYRQKQSVAYISYPCVDCELISEKQLQQPGKFEDARRHRQQSCGRRCNPAACNPHVTVCASPLATATHQSGAGWHRQPTLYSPAMQLMILWKAVDDDLEAVCYTGPPRSSTTCGWAWHVSTPPPAVLCYCCGRGGWHDSATYCGYSPAMESMMIWKPSGTAALLCTASTSTDTCGGRCTAVRSSSVCGQRQHGACYAAFRRSAQPTAGCAKLCACAPGAARSCHHMDSTANRKPGQPSLTSDSCQLGWRAR